MDTLWVLDFMLPGTTFLYNGCEFLIDHRPDLFELDPIDFENKKADLSLLFKQLSAIKKLDYFYKNKFSYEYEKDFYTFTYLSDDKQLKCYLNFGNDCKEISNNGKVLLADSSFKENNNNYCFNDYLIVEV